MHEYRDSAQGNGASKAAVWPVKVAPRPEKMLTNTKEMHLLLADLKRVAPSRATVLHEYSNRKNNAFIGVNCAALSEGVLESELFGHEKGAFTGATNLRVGRFEQAHGGTLFLDEIGAAPPSVQLRLLRVLQEREFERVGGVKSVRIDVRIVAATNVDLHREVRDGRFREDLLYRLDVVPIKLPPLRARREDIPMLIEHFMGVANKRNDRQVEGIEAAVVEKLCEYPWPGNVRQLENVMERMIVLCAGSYLRQSDLPKEIVNWREKEDTVGLGGLAFKEARFVFERRFLCAALRRHNGIITRVGESIGMSRKNLYIKLESLGIEYGKFRGV